MSEIDGVGGRRMRPEDYDAPIPGEQPRQATLSANGSWAREALAEKRIPEAEPRYSPLLFSNAALQKLSAATSVPTARTALVPAKDAFVGIKLEPLARDLPPIDRTETTRAIACRAYKLYPEVRQAAGGHAEVVCWKAVNRETTRADFVIGPAALQQFRDHEKDYEEIALGVFANGDPDAATIASMRVMDVAMERGILDAIKELPAAWNTARKDAHWVAKTVTNVATATAAAPNARVAVPSKILAETAEVDASAAGGSIRNINKGPVGVHGTRDFNCANCAIATDATLSGSPASAMAGEATTARELSNFYGRKPWTATSGVGDIERTMTNAGDRSRGIVFGVPAKGQLGHYFNVVNQNGTIRFLDGQIGEAANVNAGYAKFYLLRTN